MSKLAALMSFLFPAASSACAQTVTLHDRTRDIGPRSAAYLVLITVHWTRPRFGLYWHVELRAPGMRIMSRRRMPLDLHRSSDGADPSATLVPHLDDNITDIALGRPVCSDLCRRLTGSLHGSVHTVELGAFIIVRTLCAIANVEVVAGNSDLP
nr:hypothetical protein [Microvirga soli]